MPENAGASQPRECVVMLSKWDVPSARNCVVACVALFWGVHAESGAAALPASLNVGDAAHMRIVGTPTGDLFGATVTSVGDVNGDGPPDLVIGAPGTNRPRPASGAVYVVFGRRKPSTVLVSRLGNRGFRIDGPSGSRLGHSAAGIGDVNGDGLADILLGAVRADPRGRADAGSSYVVFGKQDTRRIDLTRLGGDGFRIDGARAHDHSGLPISAPGDLNADGTPDLLIGSFPSSRSRSPRGIAWVVYGKADSRTVDLAALDGHGFTIRGFPRGNSRVVPASGVGDFNGDQRPDLLVASYPVADGPLEVFGTPRDQALVVFGRENPGDVDLTELGAGGVRISGANDAGLGIGDYNRDGLSDVILRSGCDLTVVFGSRETTPVDLGQIGARGSEVHVRTGSDCNVNSVAAVGDVTGDGFSDVLVEDGSAQPYRRRGSLLGDGAAYLLTGSSSLAPVRFGQGPPRVMRLDRARKVYWNLRVGSAGDLNKDGTSDLLFSSAARLNRRSEPLQGQVVVVLGRRSWGTSPVIP